jgi:hypothetical protein
MLRMKGVRKLCRQVSNCFRCGAMREDGQGVRTIICMYVWIVIDRVSERVR